MKQNKLEWENVYKSDSTFHKNEFPSELVIQFVRRNYTSTIPLKNRTNVRALDIGWGWGWGNNLNFVKDDGFDTYGIDFSESAIQYLEHTFKEKVTVGDISDMPYENEYFDFCFDKSAIQHNKKEDIIKIHDEVYRILKKNGKFFSVMLADGNNGFLTGFLSEEELRNSLSKFQNIKIDFLIRIENNKQDKYTAYIIEAVK